MTERISEAASKKRRGRPPVFPEERMAVYGKLYPEIKTVRHHQNRAYACEALSALNLFPDQDDGKNAGLGWLADWPGADAGKASSVKWAVLTELGRLARVRGPDATRVVAHEICQIASERNLKTKEAASIIRRTRTGATPNVDGDTLSSLLCGFLDDYRATHPGVTLEQIHESLQVALDAVNTVITDRNEDGAYG